MTPNSRQPQILAIDDEAEVLGTVASVLNQAGYACQCATSAEMARQFARTHRFDLIVSDINLAGQSGLELCQQLKLEGALIDVPVMFLSGAQLPDIIRRSHAAGGTYYLRKPFDPEVLLELVDKALWMPHLTARRSTQPAAT